MASGVGVGVGLRTKFSTPERRCCPGASGQGGLDGVMQAVASLETAVLAIALTSSFPTQAFLRIHSGS